MFEILILIFMLVGILIGLKWYKEKYSFINNIFQIICTSILIFSMGVSLGNKPDFFNEITQLGISSFVLAIIPIIGSIIFVYIFTKKFLEGKNDSNSSH